MSNVAADMIGENQTLVCAWCKEKRPGPAPLDALQGHVLTCEAHPMSRLAAAIRAVVEANTPETYDAAMAEARRVLKELGE